MGAPAALDRIAEAWSELRARGSPERATAEGDHRFDDRLTDWSAAGRAARLGEVRALERELAAQPSSGGLAGAVLAAELAGERALLEGGGERFLLDPEAGPQRGFLELMADDHPRADRVDGEALLARMAALPRQLAQVADNLRAGCDGGTTPSPRLAARVLAQVEAALAGELSETFGAAARELSARAGDPGLGEAILRALDREVAPAYRGFGELLRDELLPAATAASRPEGLCGRAGDRGAEVYHARCRLHTTRALAPPEIEELAREELAAADRALAACAAALGARDPRAARAEREASHRAALAAPLPDDPTRHARERIAQALAAARGAFLRTTARPCQVAGVPPSQGADSPPAYYLPPGDEPGAPGRFLVNLHRAVRPSPPLLDVLAAHEAVPGHHLQLCHAIDTVSLPGWRRHADLTAYVEGWGLYAEQLAGELGLYSAAARFACAELAAWRAARMLVDVGLHARGWSIAEARAALEGRTPFPGRIDDEIDRYLADPAQVHAYVVGARTITDARRAAERRLGGAFRLPRFHARVLDEAALPLDALAAHVAAWDGS